MQTHGYLLVNGEKIKVLVRPTAYGRAFKIRKTGQDGTLWNEESQHFTEYPELLEKLKSGKVVQC